MLPTDDVMFPKPVTDEPTLTVVPTRTDSSKDMSPTAKIVPGVEIEPERSRIEHVGVADESRVFNPSWLLTNP